MATAFVQVRGSTGRVPSTSSSRARASLQPAAPLSAQEADGRRWGPIAAAFCGAAVSLVTRRRPHRAEAPKAPAAAPSASKGSRFQRVPPWMVAVLGLSVVLLHRVALKEFRHNIPPARFIVFLHTVFFLMASQLMPPSKWPHEQNYKVVALVGAMEFLGWASLQQVAFAGGLGVTAALLNGVSLLLTLLCARLILGSHVRPSAWIGAAIVAVGVGATGSMSNLFSSSISAGHVALLGASLAFSSMALTGKEVLFSGRAPLSVPMVACIASFAQLMALAMPELLSLRSFPGSLQFAQIIIGPAPRIMSLAWPAYLYIAASGALRLTFTWGLRAANASTVQLVNAVAVPFGTALLTMLSPHGHLTPKMVGALALTLAGSIIFFRGGSPSIKSSALFATILTPEELKEEQEWKQADVHRAQREEQAKKDAAEKRKQAEEFKKKSAEEQKRIRMEREEARKKQEEEKQRQKEEEKRIREEARLKAQAEKTRLEEERQAKKEAERKEREEAKQKAEAERKKKQAEYEAQKQEEQRLAIEAKKQKEAAEKQRKEEAKARAAEDRKRQEQEKKEADAKRRAEQEAARAEAERLKQEQEKAAAEQRRLKEEEERQRKEAEELQRKQAAEALLQQQQAEQKQKEEAERKRKEEEALKKQQEEAALQRQQEEARKQEEERRRQEQEKKMAAESKPLSDEEKLAQEKAKKEEQKRYSRLSFKWKMQDETRLKEEVERVKEEVEKRQEELRALLASKEQEQQQFQQRQQMAEAEARRIEEMKSKAPALQGLSKQGGGGTGSSQDSK
ncbi:unnamed protein product [Symbiodinium natans]|uniref:EamA domain-containing protein n=1 Tax=Symbiodinium natans TaxID=878477 RepID=A0A812GR54_9DINO|nr:unnamed protein product [Symbiodinium natans]